jgi:hypothetical protein
VRQPEQKLNISQLLAEVAEGIMVEDDPFEKRVEELERALAMPRTGTARVKAWLKALMPRTYRLAFCELHDYLIETRHETEHGLEAPRGHAKTAIGCAGLPMYIALEEPDKFDYFLNVQGTEPKALSLNLGMKLEFEQNDLLRHYYGNMIGGDKWTDGIFVLKTGHVFHAVSTGQRLRGTNYRLRRANWCRLDDAYEDDDIHNPEQTEKKNDWIESTLQPMLAQDRPTAYGFQGTAINDVDGLKKMEQKAEADKTGRIKFRRFCAYGKFNEDKQWEDTPAVLWPELRSREAWKEKATAPGVNPTIHAREYLNDRRDDASAIVKPSWLRGWEFDPGKLHFDRDHKLLAVRLIIDPSIGKNEENDPTGMVVLLKSITRESKAADYWVIHIVNERLSLFERCQKMQALVDHPPLGHKIQQARIEDVAGFGDFYAEAKRKVKGVGITNTPKKLDKIAHLESKSWNFQNGKVHISTGIPKLDRTALYNQLTVNHPTHDDVRDALLHGIDEGVASWGDFVG